MDLNNVKLVEDKNINSRTTISLDIEGKYNSLASIDWTMFNNQKSIKYCASDLVSSFYSQEKASFIKKNLKDFLQNTHDIESIKLGIVYFGICSLTSEEQERISDDEELSKEIEEIKSTNTNMDFLSDNGKVLIAALISKRASSRYSSVCEVLKENYDYYKAIGQKEVTFLDYMEILGEESRKELGRKRKKRLGY